MRDCLRGRPRAKARGSLSGDIPNAPRCLRCIPPCSRLWSDSALGFNRWLVQAHPHALTPESRLPPTAKAAVAPAPEAVAAPNTLAALAPEFPAGHSRSTPLHWGELAHLLFGEDRLEAGSSLVPGSLGRFLA